MDGEKLLQSDIQIGTSFTEYSAKLTPTAYLV